MKRPLIIVAGPTATGKSEVAVSLAKKINGEIISADSMQVYRHMNIGSAKITPEKMHGVPHHMIDVCEPTESFSVADYAAMAKPCIKAVYERGRIPVIAGGTGFYIQALLYDIDFKEGEYDPKLREELEAFCEKEGSEALYNELLKIDPESAEVIHPNNKKRLMRAVEYYRLTGEKMSDHNRKEREKESPYDFFYYVLTCERERMYERIERRADRMIEDGLVDEVASLKEMGCHRGMVSMQGLGYKEILDYLDGLMTLDEAVAVLKRDTRHFAKRQLTWFKREKNTRWIKMEDFGFSEKEAAGFICEETGYGTGADV